MSFFWFSSRWKAACAIAATGAVAGLVSLWYFTAQPPLLQRSLRIGFENNPPVQIRTAMGFSGLAVEAIDEAAKRAGVQLEWVETGTSSEEALRKGLVDLWPLMIDLPERHKYVHFARPWMHTGNVLLLREGTPSIDRGFQGRIAVFKMPVHVRLMRQRFPGAQLVETATIEDILKASLHGGAPPQGFIEARVAQGELREKPAECSSASASRSNDSGAEASRRLGFHFRGGRGGGSDSARNRQDVSRWFAGRVDRQVLVFRVGRCLGIL